MEIALLNLTAEEIVTLKLPDKEVCLIINQTSAARCFAIY